MNIKTAKKIAGRVGARIEEFKFHESGSDNHVLIAVHTLRITIPGRAIGEEKMTISMPEGATPRGAAHTAIVETGKHAQRLLSLCKKVYVEENLLWNEEESL